METEQNILNWPQDMLENISKSSIKIDSIGRTYQVCRVCEKYWLTEKYSRCPDCEVEFGAISSLQSPLQISPQTEPST